MNNFIWYPELRFPIIISIMGRPLYEQITTTWYGYTNKDELSDSGNEPIRVEVKTGRNDPCPCGSGKKYKKCCLKN